MAVEAIHRDGERLRYFHNAGLYELDGEDYRGIFPPDGVNASFPLPPYAELVRFDAGPRLSPDQLRLAARELLVWHAGRRPATNPFVRFAQQLESALPRLLEGDAEHYHAYAFATLRMAGSAFELAAAHIEWLFGVDGAPASQPLRDIVGGCQVLSLKLARRRPFDAAGPVAMLGQSWEQAMTQLDRLLA